MEDKFEEKMARMIRFITVRGYLKNGDITEEDAKEILSGCLSPDDESTRIDDSSWLNENPKSILSKLDEEYGR